MSGLLPLFLICAYLCASVVNLFCFFNLTQFELTKVHVCAKDDTKKFELKVKKMKGFT